ncbi:hypothetical protein GCM10007320_38260 [Pseudorhodoferax aquiterrae]|uniref:TIGR02677 family protein n=1 Tax=Pseudorhodoferax aquiterrae TaxID=747304 RepID=A0ABQ3G5S4_9BURK|nr:TIGR02677 family protein [Pseudorhodoferax aquiterrae]GHC90168.1 hypothetical protein GCM10007320_38260 [Pseudorhodoferax aquiterrae]
MHVPAHELQSHLFRHVSADKAAPYRAVMDTFAAAKRQFRLHLRPDEVLAEGSWTTPHTPRIEEVLAALTQLAEWGNLESQPDTARVASLGDFYRARFLYRLSQGGEAVEAALATFARTLARRAELQTVALQDIASRLRALQVLADEPAPDAAKVHETLRDLVRVFEGLADNAQAFMAGIARSIELQQAEAVAVLAYKRRLIDYLERFIGDLVGRSGGIAARILALAPRVDPLLWQAARREAPAAQHCRRRTPQPGLRSPARRTGASDTTASWDARLAVAMQRHGLSVAEEALASSLLEDLRRT